jgi:cytoskeletal protein CcmA (bactofilin family)
MAFFRSSNQKREADGPRSPQATGDPARPPVVASPAPPAPRPGGRDVDGGEPRSVIGRTLSIRGEVLASSTLVVEGRVEGRVTAQGQELIVGESGALEAELSARQVTVRGRVTGNITASEKIEIAPTGTVVGDICAPRVTLSDGSTFTGSINRESAPAVMERSGGAPREAVAAAPAGSDPAQGDRRGKDRPWSGSGNDPGRPSTPV